MRYSGFKVIKEALTGHKGWKPAWRDPEPQSDYDIIIIGGGGHGLATAYYLAKEYGQKRIAVLEKGWIGGGNVGRNTTIIRSNYLLDGNEPFYEFSLKLWEGLEQDFNYNAMISQRGILNLIHSDAQRDAFIRRGNAMLLNGADAEMLSTEQIKARYPFLNTQDARFPIKGGLAQHRGGTVRHDAVAWGYARACSDMGMDIIQQCEVTGVRKNGDKVVGVDTTKGPIDCDKLGMVVAGHASVLAQKAGFRLPIESVALQALVSEPIKPCMDVVVMANTVHGYMSQSDKGEMVIGGGTDGYNNYTQRGSFHHIEETVRALVETFPMIARLKMLRQWGGAIEFAHDASPIISATPVGGLYVSTGWWGGFKTIPVGGLTYAHLLATGGLVGGGLVATGDGRKQDSAPEDIASTIESFFPAPGRYAQRLVI